MRGSTRPQAAGRREGQGDNLVKKKRLRSSLNRYGAITGGSKTPGRSKVSYDVLTVNTRVTPSFPGWVTVIFPSGQNPRGLKYHSSQIISLTFEGGVALLFSTHIYWGRKIMICVALFPKFCQISSEVLIRLNH